MEKTIHFFSLQLFIPITDTIVFNKNRLRKPDIAHTQTLSSFLTLFFSGLTVSCFDDCFHYLTFMCRLAV